MSTFRKLGDITGAVPIIPKIIKVLDTARAAELPVVLLQNGWDADYVEAGMSLSPNWYKSNALKTMRARPELEGKPLARGSWDHQLMDALKPQAGDIYVSKTDTLLSSTQLTAYFALAEPEI
jgi:ureidoacrylate peracid hydrolase